MEKRKCCLTLSLLLFVLQTTAQTLGFSMDDNRKQVQIPIEVYNNLVVVPVVINQALPLKFIIDTGVRTTILTQKTFADILNMTYSRKYVITGPGEQKSIEAYVTNNVMIQLPGVTGRGHAMLVLEQDFLELRNYLGVDVHGILGYELFSRFIVKIDYQKKLLTLTQSGKFRPGKHFEALPIKIEDTKPYIHIPIVFQNGTQITAKLMVDSGASHGMLLEPESDVRIRAPENAVSSVIGIGIGGEIMGKVGRVSSVEIGKYKLMDVLSNFPDPNSYIDTLKLGTTLRNGAIGGEILSRFTVVFDFPKERIFLKKNGAYRKGFYYNLSGLTIKAKGSRLTVFEITDVRKASPGDTAGLQRGDVVSILNGYHSADLSLNIVNGILNSRPGKKIRLVIDRKGQKLKKELILANQL